MLTLSNKPLRLIASVDTFDWDATMFLAAEFFNKDWKKKENFIQFYLSKRNEKFCFHSINFKMLFFACADIKQTIIHNKNQRSLHISGFTFHVAMETFMT